VYVFHFELQLPSNLIQLPLHSEKEVFGDQLGEGGKKEIRTQTTQFAGRPSPLSCFNYLAALKAMPLRF